MLKPRSTNDHNSRESYLRAATNELRPYFAKHGLILPEKIRFAIASHRMAKKERWPESAGMPARPMTAIMKSSSGPISPILPGA